MKQFVLGLLLFLAGNTLYAQNTEENDRSSGIVSNFMNERYEINYQVALCNEKGEPLYPDSARITLLAIFTDQRNYLIDRSTSYGRIYNGVFSTKIRFPVNKSIEAVHPLTLSIYYMVPGYTGNVFLSSQTLSNVPYATFADNVRLIDNNNDVYMLKVVDGELRTVKMNTKNSTDIYDPDISKDGKIRFPRFPYPEYCRLSSGLPYEIANNGGYSSIQKVIRDEADYRKLFNNKNIEPPTIDFKEYDLFLFQQSYFFKSMDVKMTDCYVRKKSNTEYVFHVDIVMETSKYEHVPCFDYLTAGILINKIPKDATVKFEINEIDNADEFSSNIKSISHEK